MVSDDTSSTEASTEALVDAASRGPETGIGAFVAGFEGSPASEVALRWAASLADRSGAPLRVVACWTYQDVWATAHREQAEAGVPSEGELADVALRRLRESVTAVVGEGRDVECVAVHSSDPAQVLLAQSATASLVFVGSRGRGRLGAALLGSVSGRLLRDAACPVVVVPHRVIAVQPDQPATEGEADLP